MYPEFVLITCTGIFCSFTFHHDNLCAHFSTNFTVKCERLKVRPKRCAPRLNPKTSAQRGREPSENPADINSRQWPLSRCHLSYTSVFISLRDVLLLLRTPRLLFARPSFSVAFSHRREKNKKEASCCSRLGKFDNSRLLPNPKCPWSEVEDGTIAL